MSELSIRNLQVSIEGKEILKGVDLTVNQGEVHAMMGPNGTGKSTLAYTLMGHPNYEVTRARSGSKARISSSWSRMSARAWVCSWPSSTRSPSPA